MHPYAGHKQNAVGHRRAKSIMRANGGGVAPSEGATVKRAAGGSVPDADITVVSGAKSGGRIDKRARGGAVQARAAGGGITKITPSKHKPHVSVNVININRGRKKNRLAPKGPALPGPIGAPLPDIGAAPGPLAISPAGVPGMPPIRAKGGRVGKMGGNDRGGQGSGVGRLEENKRMKRVYP